ncbi:hypothetical protein ACT7CZ_27695, partial [Bacillus cereus]
LRFSYQFSCFNQKVVGVSGFAFIVKRFRVFVAASMDILCPNRPLSMLFFMKNTNKIRGLRQITFMN